MINDTNDKIRYTSFILFLEKGYEATNIRDICKVVNIKPSSLYFYYKSKQELFLSVYDEIWTKKINFLDNTIIEQNDNSTIEFKLKLLYKKILNYHVENILNEKFLLRYHLFPAEEINTIIKDKYNFWSNEENKVLYNLIYKYKDKNFFNNDTVINDLNNYIYIFKHFLNHQIINIITNNIKPTSQEFELYWGRFWNSYISNIQENE